MAGARAIVGPVIGWRFQGAVTSKAAFTAGNSEPCSSSPVAVIGVGQGGLLRRRQCGFPPGTYVATCEPAGAAMSRYCMCQPWLTTKL